MRLQAFLSKDKTCVKNFAAEKVQVDHSERPVVDDYTRCETPKFVTENDLRETNEDFQNLMFNKETAVSFALFEPCHEKTRFCICKNKDADQLCSSKS